MLVILFFISSLTLSKDAAFLRKEAWPVGSFGYNFLATLPNSSLKTKASCLACISANVTIDL